MKNVLRLGVAVVGVVAVIRVIAVAAVAGVALSGAAPVPGRLAAQGQVPAPAAGQIGTEFGFAFFQQRCMNCHGNPAVEKAPQPSALRQMTPEAIYDALASGVMKVQGEGLTDEQKRRVAESVAGRPLGTSDSGDAKRMPNRCAINSPVGDPLAGPSWNGWGVDAANTRFQPARAAGLRPAQVPDLRLNWAFGFPNGVSAFAQPTVASGRVYVGTDTGYVYALDARTGCVYWSFKSKAAIRNAMTIGPINGHDPARHAVYFGDLKANVYALDAQTGEQLWTSHVEDHFTARVTATPTLYEGRLYVPVASWEEFSAATLDYPCCSSRGSVLALDANTGGTIWKTYVIPEAPKPVRKNSKGVQLWAPAGGSVWNSPTVDPERRAVYFGTGDATTAPAAKTSDAVMALDMNTGKVLWVYQTVANDSFLVGCDAPDKSDNCPVVQGPDLDIPDSPILRKLPNGKRLLIVGTKTGTVFAFDPDRRGAVVWKTTTVPEASFMRGGIFWGGAADEQQVYFGLTGGGMVALKLSTGERAWLAPLGQARGGGASNAAAVTAIPGVAFVGGSDGVLYGVSTADGRPIWQFNTAREFTTVNQVPAKGGAVGAPGPTVAGGMLFVGSGYAVVSGASAGNVLLAFSAE